MHCVLHWHTPVHGWLDGADVKLLLFSLFVSMSNSNDLPGAVEAAMECQKLYKHIPRIHDIIVALVQQGDTDLLQKG